MRTVAERLLAKLTPPDENGCELWTGFVSPNGYGQIRVRVDGKRSTPSVHRVAYELWVGPIPEGMTIDHVWDRGCRSKLCCNPAHLEVVTLAENHRRRAVKIIQCPYGHPYSIDNTYSYVDRRGSTHRQCLTCKNARTAISNLARTHKS